jgi:hypothetical protein
MRLVLHLECGGCRHQQCRDVAQAQFSLQKILQNFSHSPSHRIFGRMPEALNINKK